MRRDVVEPIEILGGAEEQVGLLTRARTLGQYLAGIPEDPIAVLALVDREVALEHRAVGAERRDAGLDIGPPRIGKGLRRWGIDVSLEAEAADAHAQPTKLDVDVRPLGELLHRLL